MVWLQSSQRATCPPRAAVRQLSMADITFIWAKAHVAGVGLTPSGAVVAEDVRDLQSRPSHDVLRVMPAASPAVASAAPADRAGW